MLSLPPFSPRLPFFSSAGFGRVRLCSPPQRGTMYADAPESLLFFFFLFVCLQSFGNAWETLAQAPITEECAFLSHDVLKVFLLLFLFPLSSLTIKTGFQTPVVEPV